MSQRPNKAQRKRILAKLEKLWNTCPECRLGQLIGNFVGISNLYYTSDKDFEKLVDRWLAIYEVK